MAAHNNGSSSLLLALPAASSHFVLVSSRKVLANLLSSVLHAPVRSACSCHATKP